MRLKMGRALVPFEQFQDSRGKNDTAVSKGVKRGEKKQLTEPSILKSLE